MSSLQTKRSVEEVHAYKMRLELEKIDKIESVRQMKSKLAQENVKNELSDKKQRATALIEKQ